MAEKKVTKKTETKAKEVESKPKKLAKIKPAEVTPELVKKLQQEYKEARLALVSGKEKHTHHLAAQRKNIARALTVLNAQQENE